VFIRRMSEAARVEQGLTDSPETVEAQDSDVVVYHLRGAYFFGAAATLGAVLDRIAERPRAFVIDFSDVPFIDSTGARSFDLLAHKMARAGGKLVIAGASPEVRKMLLAQGAREPHVAYRGSVADAMQDFGTAA
jgi:SulP family sulfate permease